MMRAMASPGSVQRTAARARRWASIVLCLCAFGAVAREAWAAPGSVAELFATRGLDQLNARHFADAQRLFEHAVERDPQLAAYEREHKLAPSDAMGLGGIGHSCLNLATRKFQTPSARRALLLRARDAFERALSFNPEHQPSLDGLEYVARALEQQAAPALALELPIAALLLLLCGVLLRSLWLPEQRAQLRSGLRESLLAVLPPFLITRALVLGAFWLAPSLLHEADSHPHAVLAITGSPVLEGVAARWDANLYAGVALGGYRAQPPAPNQWGSLGQLPLLPVVYRFAMYVFRDAGVAALVLAQLALLLSSFVLFGVLRERDDGLARRALWVTMLLPGSLFGSVLYAESLALLWSLVAYACQRRGQTLGCALAGMLAGLTRINALALIPLLALSASRSGRVSARALIAALGPLAGLFAFMLYTHFAFGDAFAYMHELRAHRFAGQSWAVALGDAHTLFAFLGGGPGAPSLGRPLVPVLALGVVCVVAYAVAALQLLPRQRAEASYVLCGMLLALGSNLAAQPRYLWLLFPAASVFAGWASTPLRRALFGVLLAVVLFAEAVAFQRWYYVT
jgi:hypothetical protein